jgi:sigma-B regulation protein RsbU (phosphoserine phosphatase)
VTITTLVASSTYLIKQSITLQSQEKINNAYQSQLSETTLLADKFNSLLHNSLNSLKQVGAIDWSTPTAGAQVQTLLQNQKDLSRIFVVNVPLVANGEPSLIYKSSNAYGDVEQENVLHTVFGRLESLVKNQVQVVNLAGAKPEAQVGVLVPDISSLAAGKLTVLVGFVDTSNLFSNVNYEVTVAQTSGELIYASDLKTLVSKNSNYQELINKAVSSQVNSSILEFENNQMKLLGSYSKIDFGLVFISTQPLIKIISSVYMTTQKMILAGLIALCVAIIFATGLSRSIAKPIHKLTEATEKIAMGDFKVNIPHKSNDEIGKLAGSFEAMSGKIEKLMVGQKEKLRLESEMNIAATVQKTLFPATKITLPGLAMVSSYTPASECGGDLWSYFESKGKIYFIIADATGHGLPSALITVATKSTLSLVKRMLEQQVNLSLSEILSYANRSVYETSQGKIMMTCFLGVLDLASGALTYTNAGHNPPWVFSGEKVTSLALAGTRLGESLEQTDYKTKTITLKSGDKIFLYTDGIVENTNAKGVMFDKKHVRELVKKSLAKGIAVALQSLLSDFKTFLGAKKTLDDDMTVVIMEYLPDQVKQEVA